MTSARECRDRFEDIVALVMGELAPTDAEELADHFTVCDTCRQTRSALEEEEQEVRLGFEALARNLRPVEQAMLGKRQHQSRVRVDVSSNYFFERMKNMILAHKRLGAAAAATVMALAASLVIYVSVLSSPAAAYALEQTVQANNHITSYHVKVTPAAQLGEAWVQLNPDGTLFRVRMDLSSPGDGPKVSIASPNRAEVWFKAKNVHMITNDKKLLDRTIKEVVKMRALFDPKLAFEELQATQQAGKMQVVTKEPAKEGEPVTLTVTSKAAPDRREVYEVDPKTKLVERVTIYSRHGDQWEQASRREYLDYNKEIDPKVFELELPKDVITVDRIKNEFGLAKGNLTDDEIATKVVREFFEALIAEDYKKAGMIFSGMPAEKMKEFFGRLKFLRIVEIGKPMAGQHPDKGALQVPAKVEMEVNGQKTVKEFSPFVRPESKRWVICGGI